MSTLQPLIDQVEADTHSHVVVMGCDEGIRWRGETESACQLMADIVGNAKVMTREDFLRGLREIQTEEASRSLTNG